MELANQHSQALVADVLAAHTGGRIFEFIAPMRRLGPSFACAGITLASAGRDHLSMVDTLAPSSIG